MTIEFIYTNKYHTVGTNNLKGGVTIEKVVSNDTNQTEFYRINDDTDPTFYKQVLGTSLPDANSVVIQNYEGASFTDSTETITIEGYSPFTINLTTITLP